MLEQAVQNGGAGVADFQTVPAIAMLQLEPVRFDFQKRLEPRQLFGGFASGGQRQPGIRIGCDFFNQIIHEPAMLAGNSVQGKHVAPFGVPASAGWVWCQLRRRPWNRAGSLQKPDMPRFFAKNENALYNLEIQG